MTIDCTSVPKWLKAMRAATGIVEAPGSEDNPKILGMRDWIACTYDDMAEYCEEYQHDETPWCGLTAAWAMTIAGIRPPFGPTDTDKFLWALSWSDDDNYDHLADPVTGCIVVTEREGGGHVTFYESTNSDGTYNCRGGNQSDAINVTKINPSTVVALVWPRGVPLPVPGPSPTPGHKTIKKGSKGADVEDCQRILGLPVDGDFGSQTDAGVKGFQAAMGLDQDGVVGPNTWEMLEDLDTKMKKGHNGITEELEQEIYTMAQESEIADYSWKDRGIAPPGYVPGVALSFAYTVIRYLDDMSDAELMSEAEGDPEVDALAWYRAEFQAKGMVNNRDGLDTLRHLFVLLMGLGPRESSGNHWEGRDMSASNTSADTAEAGLFQTSWDIAPASPEIPGLFDLYWEDPNGFQEVFSEGLSPTTSQLQNYGSGQDGTKYQWLAKYSPAFACLMTAVGLRTRRKHWGPINNKAAEIRQEADELLKEVQKLVESVA